MEYTWDENKRQRTLKERGLDFINAILLFDNLLVEFEDTRKVYPERRYIGYGLLQGRLMCVVFTRPQPNCIKIISYRKANKREQRKYKP